MTKKTRLIILLACVACFFIGISIMIPYSMGYRFDFENMTITETGGVYVRTLPAADKITIDSKISEKPGLFTNYVFIQNLIPGRHTVLIEKSGYYNYSKTLPVLKKEVVKIEDIILFKKNINFEIIPSEESSEYLSPFTSQEKYIIRNDNLFYSESIQNSGLSKIQIATPILKKVAAFQKQNNHIIWLGLDGFLYKSDENDFSRVAEKITLESLKIDKNTLNKIIIDNQKIFVISNRNLLLLNNNNKIFELIDISVNDASISPDGKNIIYHNGTNIYIYPINNQKKETNKIYESTGKITKILWVNNNYIIFVAGDKITISETDYRDNVNITTLPEKITINAENEIILKSPDIFFDKQMGKLYILTDKNLLLSEKIIP